MHAAFFLVEDKYFATFFGAKPEHLHAIARGESVAGGKEAPPRLFIQRMFWYTKGHYDCFYNRENFI